MVRACAAAGESATFEFKKSTAEKERACRNLCAFANGQGGRVVFGITPAGKVVGQTVTDRTLEELAQEFRAFEPPLFPSVERVGIDDGHEALVLTAPRAARAPVAFRGVAYERALNTTRTMPRARPCRHRPAGPARAGSPAARAYPGRPPCRGGWTPPASIPSRAGPGE
ncbi:MAG: helix-turn-helix domain-containing protein [Rubrivivax sp.]